MKFSCISCNYATNDKSNYNRHLNSKAHAQSKNDTKIDSKVDSKVNSVRPSKFQCPKCDIICSSTSSLSRHKNKYCTGNAIRTDKTEIDELNEKLKQKELEMEKMKKDLESEYNKKLAEELKQCMINVKPTTTNYNISVKKFVQQTYPDAPPLAMLENYAMIHENKDVTLAQTLIYYHNENTLNNYLGDIIIKYYKKEDPKDKSLWSTDSSRLKYINKELIASNRSSLNEDDKGLKLSKYIIEPLLQYINGYINDYYNKLGKELKKLRNINIIGTGDKCCSIAQEQLDLSCIRMQIQNGQLKEAINKYIAPSFRYESDNSNKLIMI